MESIPRPNHQPRLVQPVDRSPTTGEVTVVHHQQEATTWALKHSGQVTPAIRSTRCSPHDTGGSGSTFKYFTMIAALTAGVQPTQALTTAGTPSTSPRTAVKTPTNPGERHQPRTRRPTLTLSNGVRASRRTSTSSVWKTRSSTAISSTIVATAQNLGVTSLNNIEPRLPARKAAPDRGPGRRQRPSDIPSPSARSRSARSNSPSAYGVPSPTTACSARPGPSCPITASRREVGPVQAGHLRSEDEPSGSPGPPLQIMMGPTTSGHRVPVTCTPYFFDKHPSYEYPVAGKTGTNNASEERQGQQAECRAVVRGGHAEARFGQRHVQPESPDARRSAGVPGIPGRQCVRRRRLRCGFLRSSGPSHSARPWPTTAVELAFALHGVDERPPAGAVA